MIAGTKLVTVNCGDSRSVMGSMKDKDYKCRGF